MDGVLEQILNELREIKELLSEKTGSYEDKPHSRPFCDTLKVKEAAEYLGVTDHRMRMLTKQGKIKHFMAGNRFLYKRNALDQWLNEAQEASVGKNGKEKTR